MDEDLFSGEMNDFSSMQRFNVDPRLLSGTNPHMDSGMEPFDQGNSNHLLGSSDCDFGLYSDTMMIPQPPFFESDMALTYEPLRHQMMGHRRSVSVPPEDLVPEVAQPPMVFHRGGTPLGDSLGTPKSSNKRWLKKTSQKKARHSPYPSASAPALSPSERIGMKRAHTQPAFAGPTSAPTPAAMRMPCLPEEHHMSPALPRFDMGPVPSPRLTNYNTSAFGVMNTPSVPTDLTDIDTLQFGPSTNTNTAILGMLGFAGRLARECEAMREFLGRGFKDVETDETESVRQEKRTFNHTVSTLTESLETLPLPAGKSDVSENPLVPSTGLEIRDIDVEKMHALLDLYNIPFAADMFMHDKKLAYLRFVGASRALMHAVLD